MDFPRVRTNLGNNFFAAFAADDSIAIEAGVTTVQDLHQSLFPVAGWGRTVA